MSSAKLPTDLQFSLESTLRFAMGSGAWVLSTSRQARDGKAVAEASGGLIVGPELLAIRDDLGDCRRCRLSEGRTHVVFGTGNPHADLFFVGEGPGSEEDQTGEPFVGPAGQLLDLMIRAMGFEPEEVYLCNVVKCRPPGNREPREDEKESCLPFLWRQIEAVRPRVVCALGAHAAKALLGSDAPIASLRGEPATVRGFTVLPTYHPAFLLRNPQAKRQAWLDLQRVRDLVRAP